MSRNPDPHTSSRRAFSLIELAVSIGIVTILATLIFSGVRTTSQKANSTKCTGNLRELGVATRMYANDNNDEIPYANYYNEATTTWATKLAPYLQTQLATDNNLPNGVFRCPSCTYPTFAGSRSHYGKNYLINGQSGGPSQPVRTIGYRFNQIDTPSKYYYLADSSPNASGFAGREIATGGTNGALPAKAGIQFRHQDRANVLFLDFHVESLRLADVPDIKNGEPPWCPRE